MSSSAFMDKSNPHNQQQLAIELGESFGVWEQIKSGLIAEHGALTEDWKFYPAKSWWTMKFLRKKRNLFFLTPLVGYFRITFVFGEKAVSEVEKRNLPDKIKTDLLEARKYAGDRGVSIEVKTQSQANVILERVNIKLAN